MEAINAMTPVAVCLLIMFLVIGYLDNRTVRIDPKEIFEKHFKKEKTK